MKDSHKIITIISLIIIMISYVIACGSSGGDSAGISYTRTADLAGDWQVRQMEITNAAEGSSWWIINTTIGSDGTIGNIAGITNSGYPLNSFDVTVQLKVKADGTVHTFANGIQNPFAAGFMNSGSNLLISVEGEGSTAADEGTAITVAQRIVNGTTYSDADLTGGWKVFSYIVPPDGAAKWYNSFASIYECGFVTSGECKYDLRYVQMNGESLSDVIGETITIDPDGRILTSTDVTYDGFMSADKKLIVAVSTNGGSEAVISFMVRSDETQTYDATDLAGQYAYVSSKVMNAASFTSDWEMGHMNVSLDGRISGTKVSNEDLTVHDMLTASDLLSSGYAIDMSAGVSAPKYGGYALVDGYIVNTTTGEKVQYIKGPNDSTSYIMGLGSDMDLAIMVINAAAVDNSYKTTILNIFHKEKSCLDAGYCTAAVGARTSDLAASTWRANGLLVGNSPMASSFMIFNTTMGADGAMSVGFSNMLNPGDGSIVEISDIMPVGEGPEYSVFRLDTDGSFWEAERYYDTFRSYLDSTGELLVGVDTEFNPVYGYTAARLFTLQNTSAAGSYDLISLAAAADEWKVVNFSASDTKAYWSVLNATTYSIADSTLGCVEVGVGIDNSLGSVANPPAGAKFDVTLAVNGDFAMVNSVGTGCSDGTADVIINAYMSADGMSAFGMSNAGAAPELQHFIRVLNAPSAYAQSDLTGTWRESYVSADGNGGVFGGYGTINMGSAVDINGTEYSVISGSEYMYHSGEFCDLGDDDCDGTVDATMFSNIDTTNGMVSVYVYTPPTMTQIQGTYMFMSADKKLMYMLMNEAYGNLAIHIFQKQ